MLELQPYGLVWVIFIEGGYHRQLVGIYPVNIRPNLSPGLRSDVAGSFPIRFPTDSAIP
jgi:hypothetical protein